MRQNIFIVFVFFISVVLCGMHVFPRNVLVPPADLRKSISILEATQFTQLCQRALQDEATFQKFKSDPRYTLLYGGYSYEDGAQFLEELRQKAPDLVRRIGEFSTVDKVGGPLRYHYEEVGEVSPSLLRSLVIAADLRLHYGDLKGLHVVEIGPGGGELASVLLRIFDFGSYTAVDAPIHLNLVEKALYKQGITRAQFIPSDSAPALGRVDLIISDRLFAQMGWMTQSRLVDGLIARAGKAYFICSTTLHHEHVLPLDPSHLKEKLGGHLAKKGLSMQEEMISPSDYLLVWGVSSQKSLPLP